MGNCNAKLKLDSNGLDVLLDKQDQGGKLRLLLNLQQNYPLYDKKSRNVIKTKTSEELNNYLANNIDKNGESRK
jgi:hypothetical protein